MLQQHPDERRARDAEAARERHQQKLRLALVPAELVSVQPVEPVLAELALELAVPLQVQPAALEPPAERPVPASW
jgi:hypothetical protein